MDDGSAYVDWAGWLPEDVSTLAVDLPGRAALTSEMPLRRVDALVDWLLPSLSEHIVDRPFALVGHDVGAIVAFELTRRLRRDRRPLPMHLFVCAAMAPQVFFFPPIHHLDERGLKARVAMMKFGPRAVSSERTIKADCSAIATHAYGPEPALDVPITAILGDRDGVVPRAGLGAWRAQTSAAFELHVISGDHSLVRGKASPILAIVRSALGNVEP
jgi:medium-chain acyl-[acyl-carrier-protein] hydrolase